MQTQRITHYALAMIVALFSTQPQNALAADFIPGEVLILYKSHGPTKSIQSSPTVLSIRSSRKTFSALTKASGQTFQHVKDPSRTTDELMALFLADPTVETVSPNYIKHISALPATPDDTSFPLQWALHNSAQNVNGTVGTLDADIDFPQARRLMKPAPTPVVIAIMDTGVDYNHPDLQDAMWINPGEIPDNGVDDDSNGFVDDVHGYDFAGDNYTHPTLGASNDGPDSDPMDILTHGTHVAGSAAATADNALGIAGAGKLKIMALKVSPDGDSIPDSATIAAIDYLVAMKARGVNIVVANASFGGTDYNPTGRVAFQSLSTAGIVLAAAAGNGDASGNGIDNDATPLYPSSHTLSNIISVAATDPDDNLTGFSNYGQTSVDVGAPGGDILSCVPMHLGTDAAVTVNALQYTAAGLSFAAVTEGVQGILYDCGLGYSSNFPSGVNGNIALIERGELYFTEKVQNAMDAGAIAVIIYNHSVQALPSWTLIRPLDWIPAVGTTQADGLTLLGLAGQTITVINRYNNGFSYESGTSMATPLVAGCIGLLAQHFPTETAPQLIARIKNNVDTKASLATKCSAGGRINLANSLDTDADQLPDWWETQYSPNLTTMNSTSDFDGNGFSDISEYRTESLPNQAQSKWIVDQTATGAQPQLEWSSQDGVSYRILATDSLTTPFQPISGLLSSTPPRNEWPIPATNAPAQFYKIELIW
jgi:subtilisin family serine protease